MHDLGNIEAFRESGSMRSGSYWGTTTDQVRDLAAWVQLTKDRGFDRVVLVGHSAVPRRSRSTLHGRKTSALPDLCSRPGAKLSPTSAATLVDLAGMGVELTDFYGVQTPNPPVARVRVAILAWFGTNGDVGTAADLELLETTLKHVTERKAASARPSHIF